MLKKSLPLLGLFLLLFIGTFVLLGGDIDLPWSNQNRTDAEEFQRSLKTDAHGDAEAGNSETENGSTAAGRGTGPEGDEPEVGGGPGKLQGRAVDERGRPVQRVGIRLTPGAGILVKDEGQDWLIEEIPEGSYTIEVWSDGFISERLSGIEIRSGRRTWQEIQLRRGVQPAGKVIDETDLRGVGNALIEFSGLARTRSASDGTFKAPYVIPESALTRITVSHDDYDRYTYVRQPTHDPNDMVLALSRGTSRITGRLIPDAESLKERQARLRLFFTTGGRHDLRREQRVSANGPFEFQRVHQGQYDLVVDFPGSRLPEIHREVLIKMGQTKDVEIRIGEGSTVTGKLHVSGPPANGVKVELINGKGLTVAGCLADPGGTFKLKGVPPGTYRAKVFYGNPWFNTESFDVDGRTPKRVDIDCTRRRLKH